MDQPDEDDDVTQRPLDSCESTTPKQCKRPASVIADEDKEESTTGVKNAIPCGQDRDEQGSGTSSAQDNVSTLPLQDIDSGPSSKRPKMKMPSTGKRRFEHSNSPKGCSRKGSVVEATMDSECLPKKEACHSVSEFYKRIMVFNRPQLPGFDELNTFEEYLSSNPKCPICFDDISMLVIPRCKCHMLCCHSCMFKHLEYSYSRRQKYLCPFCRSPIGTLFFNIKSQSNYRLLNVPRNGQLRPLHRVIKSIGLIVSENSADCAVNPLSRITYATFLSAFECPSEAYLRFRNRSTEPTHWFRAFVYLNDLHPWNYTSAQCTLPVPQYSYQVGEQLTRLKNFLCAEVCYLINSLDIMPLDYAIIKKMNDLMVSIRFLVVDMCPSVHDYFKIGTRFIKALNEILPTAFGAFLNSYNVSIGIKLYTES